MFLVLEERDGEDCFGVHAAEYETLEEAMQAYTEAKPHAIGTLTIVSAEVIAVQESWSSRQGAD